MPATVRRAAGRALASLRPLPNFVIIGAQRAGTTSLFDWLSQSRAARPSRIKEVHYFDDHFERPLWWYRWHFPLRPGGVPFEATPSLLYLPDAPCRFQRTLPRTHAVVVLRDPVARALSNYWHVVSYGAEGRSPADAIWSEPTSIQDAYKERGRYAEQLERWFSTIGEERTHVLFFEEMTLDPQGVVGPLARELGLGDLCIRPTHRNEQQYDRTELDGLREYYSSSDAMLSRMLGRALPWPTA